MGGPVDSRSDVELVREFSRGDTSAFDALYFRYRDWIVALAYRFTLHHDDSLDVLQETFSYLCRKQTSLTLTATMKTFLYPVIRNLSIEIRRKRKRMAQTEESFDVVGAPAPPGDARDALASLLKHLPDTHREVLLMRFVDDLKLEEIAIALEIPLGTVKSRLHKTIEQLRSDPRTLKYFENQFP